MVAIAFFHMICKGKRITVDLIEFRYIIVLNKEIINTVLMIKDLDFKF